MTTDITLDEAIAQLEAAFPQATVGAQIEAASNHHASGRRIRREHIVSVQPNTGGTFLFYSDTIRDAVSKAIAAMNGEEQ